MQTDARKTPGGAQTRLSLSILALLIIVAGGVWLRQYQFNPAVIALRPDAQSPGTPAEGAGAVLIDTTGSAIVPFSAPERFSPETLYEKINGRADLYLASGFVQLDTQRFTPGAGGGGWVEVFVYDMGTTVNAFSVFSMQRREGAQPVDIAPNAYRTDNALFMAHENDYLEFIGTDATGPLQRTVEELARRYVFEHGGRSEARAPGADLFPDAGFVAGSLQLINANAFGYAELDQVYTAQYEIDGMRLNAFVSERPSAEAAEGLARTYAGLLAAYGATRIASPPADAVALQVFDTYEMIFNRGNYFAGVHEAADLIAAGKLASRLAGHLDVK